MAISQDGTHKFGLIYPTATGVNLTKGFILESFTRSDTSNRVDLNDGNGEPLDTVVVPQRKERSFTMQMGSSASHPRVGDLLTVDSGSSYYILTDVSINETQEDFVRIDATGYIATNGTRPIKFKKITGGANFNCTSVESVDVAINGTSVLTTGISSTSAQYINAYVNNQSDTQRYVVNYTPDSGSIDLANSTFSSGTTVVTASTDDTKITFRMTSVATQAEIGLKFV